MLLESGLVDEVDVDKCLQQAQEAYHQNHFASSTQICKTLLTAQPDNVLALHQLGLVELAKGKIGEAISYFNRVVALDASMFQSTYNLGLCYHQLNNLDKAQAYYAKTLDANPEFVEAYNNLGIVHQYLGNHQKALELFKEAIRLQPDFVEAYYNASQCHDTAYNRSLLGNIKAFCDDPRLSSANRARAWFMRASILENQGEYAASMEAYQHANRLIHTPFNHTRFEQEIDAFIQFFTPEHLRKFSRPKFNSERYIFVVGMPRSGTSLIEQILSSHPHVAGIGEANHIQHLAVEITQGSAHTLIDAISSISPYTPLRSALDTL
ncbi:MAG: tetratricopeptide repeat protein, partial [Gammaproteobacteria bacterium]|nr:tetratricopeptide repeat protein [Gammaproteobacteria bacterium]